VVQLGLSGTGVGSQALASKIPPPETLQTKNPTSATAMTSAPMSADLDRCEVIN
jgi:hypothetical protein